LWFCDSKKKSSKKSQQNFSINHFLLPLPSEKKGYTGTPFNSKVLLQVPEVQKFKSSKGSSPFKHFERFQTF
jgi:hypothetical protein